MDFPSKNPLIHIVGIEVVAELLEEPFVSQENWLDLLVFQSATNGDLVAMGQINCLLPSEPFQNGVFEDGFVGITILEVFIGDIRVKMTHKKWPILECGFAEGHFLSKAIDYFA